MTHFDGEGVGGVRLSGNAWTLIAFGNMPKSIETPGKWTGEAIPEMKLTPPLGEGNLLILDLPNGVCLWKISIFKTREVFFGTHFPLDSLAEIFTHPPEGYMWKHTCQRMESVLHVEPYDKILELERLYGTSQGS